MFDVCGGFGIVDRVFFNRSRSVGIGDLRNGLGFLKLLRGISVWIVDEMVMVWGWGKSVYFVFVEVFGIRFIV